jgi:hypothetical protein
MMQDAFEGEQKLNYTEAHREHLWRLLQGGELIAPEPPLPPRVEDMAGFIWLMIPGLTAR